MILAVVSLAIYGLALVGPPVCAIAPWGWSRPASPWLMGAGGAAITVMYGRAGLVSAAAVSSLWVLVAGAWWVLRRSRRPERTDWETAYEWLEAARQEHVEGLPQRRDEAA